MFDGVSVSVLSLYIYLTSRSNPSSPPLTACNPNSCRASGRGLQPKGLRVKEVADFKVYTKGGGSGELIVTVKGPSKTALDIFIFYLKNPVEEILQRH